LAKQAAFDERGLVKEMRPPATHRGCGELGAVVHPDIRQPTAGFRDQFLNTTRVSSGICWPAADMRLAA
jgi:hypothetical protein